ncbi:MAG: glycosyltransferase [Thermoplasmata archaeon]|nr:glycosyltransferase [Thermoplasmata archaeon]
MLPEWIVAVALAGALVVVLFQGIPLYLAAQMPRLEPAGVPELARTPRVTVIIAARDEELDIGSCLDDLLAQTYPEFEIIVVDGASSDRTVEVARQRGSRVRVIEEPPLPSGWVGKNWGCAVGARAATGEFLLFTDADVRYHPEAIRATVAWALREKADLATLAPRVVMIGFWEKLILPFYTQVVLTYFRAPRVNHDGSRTAMANGQYLLVSRSAYDAVGGHEKIRGAILEDVRLAQEFRARRLRLRVAWAPELLSTRMYRDRHEMFEGLLKNVHGTRFSAARQLAFLAGLIGLFWLPLVILPLGIASSTPLLIGVGAVLYLVLFAKHVAFAAAIRGSAVYGLLFPLAVGFYVVLVGASLVRGVAHRPLLWKGRAYPRDG